MTKDKDSTVRSFHFVYIVTLIFGTIIQFSDESEFVVDMSKLGLTHVPKDLPPETKVLDLSQNYISELHLSNVSFLSGLKVLRLSHNRIQCLDVSIFKFNQDLEYLDLSHNRLQKVSCHPIMSLKHLDLSFNDFDALPICKEFGNLTQLNFLGLSATKFQQLDLLPIAHLHLSCILLDLEGYYVKENEKESLQILNTKELHLVFHPDSFFSVQVNISVNSLRCLQLTNIKLNDDNCQVLLKFLTELTRGPNLLNFTLNHVETTWKCLIRAFQFLWPKPIEYLNIYNLTIVESIDEEDFTYQKTTLKALKMEHVINRVFLFSQTALYTVFSEMNIMMLTISDTFFVHMLCPQVPSTFKFLNFTQNVFTDSVFQNCNTLARLETLILQKNKLKDLFKVGLMTKDMLSLEILDVSWNSLEYDRHDENCIWVGSIVVLDLSSNLEKEDIKICLHERNFVPGKSIVENIINCIEKSYKSIFVLSPNFVQSEWCHYELYFAHHNLFHEGSNNLILILLEPIPQNSIPGKYHKLRALMAQRTYLEWPKEKSKHGLFWANIRAAFNMKLTLITENNDIPT
nr:toll-like receptor 6 [Vicugna pacos]